MTQETPETQVWSAERYAENARFVADLGGPVLELLDARPGERVLDLGCGDGVLTRALADRGVDVVGADSAPALVEEARRLGLDVRLVDGHDLAFDGEFDAVVSNAALHWMKRDPDAVLAGVRRALKPGGRFVAEMGGHGNVAAITVALFAVLERRGVNGRPLRPWYFPSAEEYAARLERAGFAVRSIGLFPRPTRLPTDMVGWLETFADPFLAPLAEGERGAARREAADLLAPVLRDAEGRWIADYVRLRFAATRVD